MRMSLTPGTRFGTYEVVQSLGSGGMGEVYRARDAKLRREVALKVLPAHHRLDADRQARFAREGLSLAALNHPNIATVHGVEDVDGVQALVMELVDGQTFADRLEHHVAGLPIADAIAIARQMADALEAAHAGGVVHRDLKPANIKIRSDGVVKVLDFGIAKALETRKRADDASVPTMTLTAEHTVVGTPAYMSPEQARGQEVDQRTDIWAFGCVLYELLTGQRAFRGSTGSDTIAAVLDREPEYDRLPTDTPPLVRRLVKRCLEKDPRRRLRDIADARLDLDDAPSMAPVAGSAATPRQSRVARLWLPLACAAIVGAAAATLAIRLWPRSTPVPQPMHLSALLPPGVTVTRGPGRQLSLALSPDGRTLVIAGTDGDS
jgi:serine/threonine protein kinase